MRKGKQIRTGPNDILLFITGNTPIPDLFAQYPGAGSSIPPFEYNTVSGFL
jgi:hypothetical protein